MRFVGALTMMILLGGCTTATIQLKNGESIEAKIGGSDASAIYLVGVSGNSRGGVGRISRTDIEDIDHPGDVVGVIGIILGAGGLGMAIYGISMEAI